MSKLLHASKSNPCPICTKTDWCYKLSDTLWCCKRSDSAPPDWIRTTKQDSDGAWYFAIENGDNGDRAAKKEEWERLKAEREVNTREFQHQEFKTQLTAPQRDPLIRALSQELGLSSQHRQMLRERGLTDEQIKAGVFFSIAAWQEVSNRYPLNLPGIKQTKDGKRFVATTKDESTGKYVGGIAIVAIDASVLATGWQLMTVPRIEDKKYAWALGEKSSHLPIGNGELPIQVVGTATNPDTVWSCEGLLKSATASSRINDRFIGASSGLFRSSPSQTTAALEGVKTIKLTVDAGDAINPQRVRHWRLETEFFQSLGLTVLFPWWGQITKEKNDIDELTTDELKAIAYLTPDRFFEMADFEAAKLNEGMASIDNKTREDEHTHLLQKQLGNLLEVKGKKAPSIFQGDLYKSLLSAANNFNIPVEILVFCLLPILSARIPSETRLLINPGTNYLVPALRWNALIGETGTKKTPVLKALLAPLLSIQKQIATKYKEQKDIYDKEYGVWKTEKVNDRGEEPTPPAPMIDCYFSDFTIESIGQSISDHPDDSYLVFVDELAGFFKSMDAYRKAGGDRQKWLDLYNAGALKINRKGSPTIFCSHTSVSLLGGLQPSVLEQMIKTDESSEDGLWNRFMFCRLPQAKTAAFSHNSISLFDCLSSLYLNLAAAKPVEHKLSDAAKPLWEAWHDAIEERIMTETSELVRGTYAKVEGVAGRNALIVHRVIAAQGEERGSVPDTAISAEVMQIAIEWTQWELGQTLLEYQRLGLTEDPELSRILRFIDKFEGKGWVNARMVTHWWSPKPKPPANELRIFMAKVVSLGYATDNGKPSDSSDYQILILEKGGNNGNNHPETKPQQQESLLPPVITNPATDTPGSSNDENLGVVTTSGNKDGNNQNNGGTKLDPVVTASVVTTAVTSSGNSPNMAINGHHSDSDDDSVTNDGNKSKAFPNKASKPLVTTVTTIFNKNGNSQSNGVTNRDSGVVTTDAVTTAVTSSGNSPNMAINGRHSNIGSDTVISNGNSTKALSSKAFIPLVTTVTTISDNKNLKIGNRVGVKGTKIEGEIAGWTKNRAEAWLQLDDGAITENYASKDLVLVRSN
jgi:Protein of unknown function (DUF3987)